LADTAQALGAGGLVSIFLKAPGVAHAIEKIEKALAKMGEDGYPSDNKNNNNNNNRTAIEDKAENARTLVDGVDASYRVVGNQGSSNSSNSSGSGSSNNSSSNSGGASNSSS